RPSRRSAGCTTPGGSRTRPPGGGRKKPPKRGPRRDRDVRREHTGGGAGDRPAAAPDEITTEVVKLRDSSGLTAGAAARALCAPPAPVAVRARLRRRRDLVMGCGGSPGRAPLREKNPPRIGRAASFELSGRAYLSRVQLERACSWLRNDGSEHWRRRYRSPRS